MKNKVTLIKDHLLKKLREKVREDLRSKFKEGDRVCIKTHMGEYGNLFYVRPSLIEMVADELKQIGAQPFIFDSPVAYPGSRQTVEGGLETARKNGFSEQTMGCPIIISDEGVEVKSQYFSKIEVSKSVIEADGLLVISHFKGHQLTNYGGAIKNLGMGCVTKQSKIVQHRETKVEIGDLDKCIGCGLCVEKCPQDAFGLENGKVMFEVDKCFGCGACALILCQQKVFKSEIIALSQGLAEVASLVLKEFDKSKTLFVNVLLDITNYCDCKPYGDYDVGYIVAPNIGMVVGGDIVAIDKASLDLVDQATDNKFGGLWPADKNWQIEWGEKYGLGSGEYELVEI